MSETMKGGRASAEIAIVNQSRAGGRRSAPVMTIRFTKEAGVSFSDGGRLAYWLVRRIENGIHEVDPDLVAEWISEGFGATPAPPAVPDLELIEGEFLIDYDGTPGVDRAVVQTQTQRIPIAASGHHVRLWREKGSSK